MNLGRISPRAGQCWIENHICYIPLQDGTVAKCDEDRIDEVNQRSWMRQSTARNTYITAGFKGKNIAMHRFLYPNPPEGMVIDHINGDVADNRSCNLRFCTFLQNMKNQKKRKNNTTGYKGVDHRKEIKSKPFSARIGETRQNGRQTLIRLGNFKTAEEAAKRYDEECVKRYGEFACTNFPIENYLPKK